MLTDLQKKTAKAIINIFETGRALGDYGNVTVLKGDTGHLTYGRSQTTLASGNLALLINAYCDAKGKFADLLKPYLQAFERCDVSLDTNEVVKNILRQAGSDPTMKNVQEDFFDRVYWEPALKSADYIGVSKPLSISVVYDSRIHGSYYTIRDMVNNKYGEVKNISEQVWINKYVDARKDWLANNSNSLLHKTVYRMDAFRELIRDNKWELPLPLTVRNVVINEPILDSKYEHPVMVSANNDERVLFLATPIMKGEDVKRLQNALNMPQNEIDGVFGDKTDTAVCTFQSSHGLKVDGKVGPATWAALGV